MKAAVSQRLKVLNEVGNLLAWLLESHQVTSTFQITPVDIGEDSTEDERSKSKNQHQHRVVTSYLNGDFQAVNFFDSLSLLLSPQCNHAANSWYDLDCKSNQESNFREEEEQPLDELFMYEVAQPHYQKREFDIPGSLFEDLNHGCIVIRWLSHSILLIFTKKEVRRLPPSLQCLFKFAWVLFSCC